MGTLNLVGWLSETLSRFRQLQQLPMVSEQPACPGKNTKDSKIIKDSSPKPCSGELWQNQPAVITYSVQDSQSLPQGIHTLNPGPDTHWININLS